MGGAGGAAFPTSYSLPGGETSWGQEVEPASVTISCYCEQASTQPSPGKYQGRGKESAQKVSQPPPARAERGWRDSPANLLSLD